MSTFDGGYSPSAAQEPDTLYCANHPNVPTYLRCGQCGKPICAKCRVSTPVGFKCLECANISVLPTYAVRSTSYVQAAAAGFGVATLVGALWGLLPGFTFWACLIMGIAVSEAVSAAVKMKRGPGLQIVGLAAVAWGIIVSRVVLTFLLQVNPFLVANIPGNDTFGSIGGLLSANLINIWQLSFGNITALLFLLIAFALTYIRLR